ncbi:MAG: NADPH:quinone reductase [Blastocatellia bacterium]|nr:NADPH:quinone reductase [Blastocatellia bacterium]
MKQIRVYEFGGPEVMKLEEVTEPVASSGQVVVRVHAAGVNPVDTYIRAGIHNYRDRGKFPFTPGMDAGGVVESVGEGVNRVKPGDRVYVAGSLTGTYAEKTLCNQFQVHPLPDSVSYAQGAAVFIPYATAYRALFQRARAVAGETVLIHGASGGVGIAAVQIARAAGMRVIGTVGTEKGKELVETEGAHFVVNHKDPDYLKRAAAYTNRNGFDVILEMLANVNLGKDLEVLVAGGRVVVIGNRGTVEINPREAMSRDASILGMSLLNTPANELLSIHAAIVAGLESGVMRPIVGKELHLTEAAEAHRLVLEPGAYGKIVLLP